MSDEKEDEGPLKEILRLGKFLAHICKAIGHDYSGDGCCERCGAVGTACREKEQRIRDMELQMQQLRHENVELTNRLNRQSDYYGDGSYRQSDRSDNSKFTLGVSPKPSGDGKLSCDW